MTVTDAMGVSTSRAFAIGINAGTDVMHSALILAACTSFALTIGFALASASIRRNRRDLIKRPPGGWLLMLADCICRKPTMDMIGQTVADMRVEYCEALKAGHDFKANWIIRPRLYVHIARALTIDRLIGAMINYALGAFRAGK